MNHITLLTDYRNTFGSKHFDTPYRSGFDKTLLKKHFTAEGFETTFLNFSEVDFRRNNYNKRLFLYTSSEDIGYRYKSYIEDIVMGLELSGARVIPCYKYLKANNNKVFMELLRDLSPSAAVKSLKAGYFGTAEDFFKKEQNHQLHLVIKKAEGASGRGVFLANNLNQLKKYIGQASRTRNLFYELWDWGRTLKHKNYTCESGNRQKFIAQQFVPGLQNDWKIYIFGNRLYVFYRPIFKKRGIRASGGGYDNYFYGSNAKIPEGLFNFAHEIFTTLDVPHVSLDIGYDGNKFYLFEFQCLYFGTAGIPYSKEYFTKKGDIWNNIKEDLEQEKVYVESIVQHINKGRK